MAAAWAMHLILSTNFFTDPTAPHIHISKVHISCDSFRAVELNERLFDVRTNLRSLGVDPEGKHLNLVQLRCHLVPIMTAAP